MNLLSLFKFNNETEPDTKVILVSCNETFLSPKAIIEETWGKCKEVLLPGALLGSNEDSERALFGSLIETCPVTEHFVVSSHSLCTFFANTEPDSVLHELEKQVRSELPELDFVSRRVFLQQRWMQKVIPRLKRYAQLLGSENISVHGWLYEPETKWISALEEETGEFVPLNVYSGVQFLS